MFLSFTYVSTAQLPMAVFATKTFYEISQHKRNNDTINSVEESRKLPRQRTYNKMRVRDSSVRQQRPQWGQSARDRKNEESKFGREEGIASPSRGRLPIASPSTKAVMKPTARSALSAGVPTSTRRVHLATDEFRESSTQRARPRDDIIDLTDVDEGDLHHNAPQRQAVTRLGPNRYRIPVAPASPRGVGYGQVRIPPSPPASPSAPFPAEFSHHTELQRLPNSPRNNDPGVERQTESTHARSQRFSENISNRLRQIYDSRPGKDTGSITAGAVKRSPVARNAPDDFVERKTCVSSTNGCIQDFTEDVSYGLSKVQDDVVSRDGMTATTADSEYQNVSTYEAREALRNMKGKMGHGSGDEFDTEACIVSTRECVQIFTDDVKNAANFAQSKVKEMKQKAVTSTDDDIVDGERQPEGVAGNGAACVAGTQDCMFSFQEDVSYVAGLGISKIQEIGATSDSEAVSKAPDQTSDDTTVDYGVGCVSGTQDCMQSFQEDVAFVAGFGMNKIFPKRELPTAGNQESALAVEGASRGNAAEQSGWAPADDDSGVVAATLDCFGQFKDDLNFGIHQMKDMKITELEVRGMLLALSSGLSDQALLAIEADAGSVLTESDMTSELDTNTDAGSDIDALGDEASLELSVNEDSIAEEDMPDIDDMSYDPFLEDEASQESAPEEEETALDPVAEELGKLDPPEFDHSDDEALSMDEHTEESDFSATQSVDPPASDTDADTAPMKKENLAHPPAANDHHAGYGLEETNESATAPIAPDEI